ncbi:restriction endonuclease subunit S [Streptomyces sp. NPDC051364]|uniref:restriction endonuclease subunit S n=1 Tax=Streptomyces sp. NPDC051364 TaxID=3155799 RepID=UPI00343053FC
MSGTETNKNDPQELPRGWAWATVADVGDAELGRARHPDWHTGPEMRPYLRVANVFEDRIDATDLKEMDFSGVFEKYRLEPGDVLLNEGQSPHLVGRPAIYRGVPADVAFTNSLIRFRANTGVLQEWALLVFRRHMHFGRFMREVRITTNIAHLSATRLRTVEFPVPPTAEQHRIVDAVKAHLARLDAIEAKLHTVLGQLDRLEVAVMSAAATGLLDPDEQHASSAIPSRMGVDDGPLPDTAVGWTWKRLEDIADVVGGVTKDSKRQGDPDTPEVPYLRVANAQRARLDLTHVTKIRVAEKVVDKLRLREGDLLMAEGGDRDKLGRGWIWEDQLPDCIHQNHLFRARLRDDATHPKLLAWYVNSAARAWFESNGKQSVNLASISISKVKQLPVPTPPPESQVAAVKAGEQALARLAQLTEHCRAALAHNTVLRRALLADAFAGRLVPQDSADEPAEELLKRIRVEREAIEAEKKAIRRVARARAKADTHPTMAPPPPAHTTSAVDAIGEQATLPLEFSA